MLKPEILRQIAGDTPLMARIAGIRRVSFQTVERWVQNNHPSLMHIKILEEIAQSFKIKNLKDLYE